MKKKRYMIIYVLIFLILSLSSVKLACSLITVGDKLYYRVTKSTISAEIGFNKVSESGFKFNGINYPQNTKIEVDVNYVGEGMNGYYLVENTSRKFGYSVDFLKTKLQQYLTQTSHITRSLLLLWERENFEQGYYFTLYPYIDPIPESWEYLNEIGLEMKNELLVFNELGYNLEAEYYFSEKNSQVYLETWNKGRTNGQYDELNGYPLNLPPNSSFENHFQVAFDKSSGQLLGMRMKGSTFKDFNNEKIDVSLDYEIEKIGFNLRAFKLSNNAIYWILIFSLIIIVAISIVSFYSIRKQILRRKKNLLEESGG